MNIVLSLILLFSFGVQSKEIKRISYKETLLKIKKIRKKMKGMPLKQVSSKFEELLVNDIFPYWYKTPWTFSGHT